MTIVSSYNEWDPLEEVIIGTARGAGKLAFEPALAAYYPKADPERGFKGAPYPPEDVERAERQLDTFALALEKEGVTVQRPDPVNHIAPFSTPDFEVANGHAQTCPRDVMLVVGDRIIEVPMAQRGRFFEYRAYRRLVKEYFAGGAQWVAAPRPQLTAETYTEDYTTEDELYDFTTHPALTEFEPLFDAASFTRCGRDIFVQPDVVTNRFGIEWLRRYLGPEFRVRVVEFTDRYPQHIDTTLVPLRPGLALTNPERPFKDDSAKFFADNDWRLVDAVPSVRTGPPTTRDVSNWISMNILMLNPETVVVESAETPLIELFKSLKIDVITVDFDAVFQFGGSFHCCSLDIRRQGELQSYFA
ncbi:amidinotransferase [Saccharothrix australiensis]|uniref:Glycine amidinotransferase n=1 Tax=Saccharothrix australiensis TaxID=2072 RepID=A0A495W8N7_9PSEU|nr:amidinotransferase [Saccharothrix australiensis]RKT57779.1 glycine amidinotransferase [Saccharothrix australiensis]